ncbi:hypothetical protein [Goodfellowiella coeruleoviolacea]|nr:hypothetical protein [Goodfellowiella coeruleoviolacea]
MGNSIDQALNPWRHNGERPPTGAADATAPMSAGGGGGGGNGGSGGITVDPAALRRGSSAAGELLDRVNKDGRLVDDANNTAASALSAENFQLGKALKNTADLWYQQVTTLAQACHKIEESLAANAEGHQLTEDANEMSMSQISQSFN